MELNAETIHNLSRDELKEYCKKMMGNTIVEKERNYDIELPNNIDIFYDICKKNWKKTSTNNNIQLANQSVRDITTLPRWSMESCGDIILEYIKKRKNWLNHHIKIIDPFAGNGVTSKIIYNKINRRINIEYIASDFQNLDRCLTENSHNVEFNIDCVDSIVKHQENSDILLLICPPPYSYTIGTEPDGFSDYFAIKKWTILSKKVLIFVGEMGRTDGTEGMYHYMMNNDTWKLVHKQIIASTTDIFDRHIEKEIFIFENKNHY